MVCMGAGVSFTLAYVKNLLSYIAQPPIDLLDQHAPVEMHPSYGHPIMLQLKGGAPVVGTPKNKLSWPALWGRAV